MQTAATPPQFTHPEIENLYRYGLEMPPAIIESILQLPRQTLLADLEAVLRDAILRFERL